MRIGLAAIGILAASAAHAVSADDLALGLEKLHWDMTPQEAREAYPALAPISRHPGIFPLSNQGSLYLDDYAYQGCTFDGVLRFSGSKLKSVELTKVAPERLDPPCRVPMEAELSARYGMSIDFHESSKQPFYPFAGFYGRYRGPITGVSYQRSRFVTVSFSDLADPAENFIIYDVQVPSEKKRPDAP